MNNKPYNTTKKKSETPLPYLKYESWLSPYVGSSISEIRIELIQQIVSAYNEIIRVGTKPYEYDLRFFIPLLSGRLETLNDYALLKVLHSSLMINLAILTQLNPGSNKNKNKLTIFNCDIVGFVKRDFTKKHGKEIELIRNWRNQVFGHIDVDKQVNFSDTNPERFQAIILDLMKILNFKKLTLASPFGNYMINIFGGVS